MLQLTFFHLIAIFQFSDTSIYMTIEGYTPNFINFGRSAAEQSLAEKAQISVASLFSDTFITISEQLGNPRQRNFKWSQLSSWATKIDEIWCVTLQMGV